MSSNSQFNMRFANLGCPNRIWAVSAINGQLKNLVHAHKSLLEKFRHGDCIVYTGNYLCGTSAKPMETLDEILSFTRKLNARYGTRDGDIVFLRGIQEEIFSKVLQLQFAPDAEGIVKWVSSNHPELDSLLKAYGGSLDEAARISREGILCLTRWSTELKTAIRRKEGHEAFFSGLRRAAFTDNRNSNDNNLLFVHAGFNPHLPLISQGDSFWWSAKGFNDIFSRYEPFRLVVRGHDPFGLGVHVGKVTMSLDGKCGKPGGKLVMAEMTPLGDILEISEN